MNTSLKELSDREARHVATVKKMNHFWKINSPEAK